MITLWIGLAGGIGAVARLVVDGEIRRRWPSIFPWATLFINITGSVALGVLTGLVLYQGAAPDVKLIAGTGFCGGYTTFSTASFETIRLAQRGAYRAALAYGLGSLALTLGAGAAGLALVR